MKRPYTGLLVIGLIASATASAQTTFESAAPGLINTTPSESFDVDWVDVDGDGDLDLYVANGNSLARNELFINQGDGSFLARTADPVVTAQGNSSSAVFEDMDGDGDLDLLVTSRLGGDNQLFFNDGGLQGGVPGEYTRDFSSIVANDGGNSQAAAFGDMDGDGDPDLFVVNDGADNFFYRNNGGGFAKVLVGVAVSDGGDSTDVELVDVDGDGDVDVFVSNDSGRDEFLYLNNGGGQLIKVTGVAPTTSGGDSKAAGAGDLDGDGDVDLLLANFLEANKVFVNQGGAQGGTEGAFVDSAVGELTSDVLASFDITLFDFDLDGDLDVASANCCGQDNALYVNSGVGLFTRVTQGPHVTGGGYSQAMAFGDYDKDGAPDLAVANITSSGSNLNALYDNRSPGTFERLLGVDLVSDVHEPFDLLAGDLDGDDDADLLLLNTAGLANALYLNQGGDQGGTEGEFVQDFTSGLSAGTASSYAGLLADVDGDGDSDVVVANRSGNDNEIFLNQGGLQGGTTGAFAALVGDPAVSSGGNTRAVAAADIDRDGDVDILFGNAGGEDNQLFVNQGGDQGGSEGSFVLDATSALVGMGGATFGVTLADVDGDGDEDLFVANRNGEANALLINQGGAQAGTEGQFMAQVGSAPVNDGGDSFAGSFGDPDNDGDLDLFVANVGVNFFYVNQGGLQGGDEGDWFAVTGMHPVLVDTSSRQAEWADFDDDGDDDLFVPSTTGDNELYRSLDTAWLPVTTAWVASEGGNSRAAVFADLDGDLDLELAVANFGEATDVYVNTSPDVTIPDPWIDLGNGLGGINGVPSLAGNGTLEDSTQVIWQVQKGAPNTSTTFLIGISTLFAPFKGGTLVPAPDILLPGLVTDSNGFYFFGVTWPSGVPSGAQLFFQVWMPDATGPAGFSATNGLQATTP